MPVRANSGQIVIEPVETETISLALVGTSPLIMNAMSEKARSTLLVGGNRKTAADRRSSVKHDPLEEYRGAMYRIEGADTLFGILSSAVKGAMMTAALDLPGARKTQIGRLVYVRGNYCQVYGIPRLLASVVRSADINRTPDIRSRPIFPTWGAIVTISYVTPLLTANGIGNLLNAAGVTAGIGDWRPEKGKGSYGQFIVTTPDDPQFTRLKATSTIEAQQQAIDEPECYDLETEKMLAWYKGWLATRK